MKDRKWKKMSDDQRASRSLAMPDSKFAPSRERRDVWAFKLMQKLREERQQKGYRRPQGPPS